MKHCKHLISLVILLAAAPALAATLQVGPTRLYTTVQAAYTAASTGDTIEIDSGTYDQAAGWVYVNGKHNLTFRGVGPTRPVLDAQNTCLRNKGIFVIETGTNNITIENLELKNARLNTYRANAAGVRAQGTDLTLRNCYIHDNDDGVLGGDGNVLFEYCEFSHNGYGDGQSHNIYISTIDSFTMRYCYSHDTVEGHEVKTRANTNYILYNLLSSENGTGSRELQLAQGGTAYVIGNVIQQGPNSHNGEIISYGGEGTNPNPYLYIVNNTVINLREDGTSAFLTKNNSTATGTALLQNNIFLGFGGETLIAGSGGGAVTQITNWVTTKVDAHLLDVANHDYHLTAASTGAINMGTAPGTGFNSVALSPLLQYVHLTASESRPTNGAIDIGAYEYALTNQPPTVNTGADLDVYEGQAVTLHAAASDPDNNPLTYAWTQILGKAVTLSAAATADASFTAPAVTTVFEAGQTFRATVNDGQGGTAFDTVNVRIHMLGDITRDDAVGVSDLWTFAAAWGTTSQDPAYNVLCDFNADGFVDVIDLLVLAENWTRTLQ